MDIINKGIAFWYFWIDQIFNKNKKNYEFLFFFLDNKSDQYKRCVLMRRFQHFAFSKASYVVVWALKYLG